MSLSAHHISYQINPSTVLVSNVSIDLVPGKITTVLGPNGSGKSTLVKLMSGELVPTGGDVSLDGANLNSVPPDHRARTIGVLPQTSQMDFPWQVYDVVALGRLPHGKSSSARIDEQIVWQCLDKTDTRHLASRLFQTLSGGEKQRVHLARVLAQLQEQEGTDLTGKNLILDEPTSALDISHQHRVLSTARKSAESGAAVLVILHDLNLAARYSDIIHLMNQGAIVASGKPMDVLTPEIIRAVYGVPATIYHPPESAFPMVITHPEEDQQE